MKNLKELGTSLFAHHPEEKVFHVTSDGQAFTEKNKSWAEAHAKTLEDKKIIELDSDDYVSEEIVLKKVSTTEITEKELAKAARAALTPQYVLLFGKNPAPTYSADKMKELIDAELAKEPNNQEENSGSAE